MPKASPPTSTKAGAVGVAMPTPSAAEILDTSRGRPLEFNDMQIRASSAAEETSKKGLPPTCATDIPVNAASEDVPAMPPSTSVTEPSSFTRQTPTLSDPRAIPYRKLWPFTTTVSVVSICDGIGAPVTAETAPNLPSAPSTILVSAAFCTPVRNSSLSTSVSLFVLPACASPDMARLSNKVRPPSPPMR